MKTLKRKIVAFVIAYVSKFSLRFVLSTCHLKVHGLEQFKKMAISEKCILMLWHNRLSLVSEILFKLTPNFIFSAFISKSRDGDPLDVLANSYKTGKAIRVPHNRRHQALKELIESLKNSSDVIIITPDGPKGPRYVVKPGIALAAVETNAKIIPFTWSSSKFWQLNSWDKLMFPKPFSTISITFGNPISLNQENALSENQLLLKEELLDLEAKANRDLFQSQNDWPK